MELLAVLWGVALVLGAVAAFFFGAQVIIDAIVSWRARRSRDKGRG